MGETDFEACVFRLCWPKSPHLKLVPFLVASAIAVPQHLVGLKSSVAVLWGWAVIWGRLKISMGAAKGMPGYMWSHFLIWVSRWLWNCMPQHMGEAVLCGNKQRVEITVVKEGTFNNVLCTLVVWLPFLTGKPEIPVTCQTWPGYSSLCGEYPARASSCS